MADSLPLPDVMKQYVRRVEGYQRQGKAMLDQSTPYVTNRWLGTLALLVLFLLRIVLAQGWYIVCYALFIYLLNLFLAFLQPRFDPSLEQDLAADEVEEGPTLPSNNGRPTNGDSDEFKPFIRRLPEFKFWLSATRAILISLVSAFLPITDVPVYWPILLFYFLLLFGITMRRQIQHMVKYKYVPFDLGKAKYGHK